MFFEALETLAYQACWEWADQSLSNVSIPAPCLSEGNFCYGRQPRSNPACIEALQSRLPRVLHIECSCAFKAQPALHGAGGVAEASLDILKSHFQIEI